MTRFALLLAMLPAAAVAGTHPERLSIKPACPSAGPSIVAGKSTEGFQRLDQLPPANEQLTVLRSIGGCQKPVIVRYGIGGNSSHAGHSGR